MCPPSQVFHVSLPPSLPAPPRLRCTIPGGEEKCRYLGTGSCTGTWYLVDCLKGASRSVHSHDPGTTKSTGGMRKAAPRSSTTAPRQSVNDRLISLRCGTPGRRRCQRSLSRASSLRGSAVRRPRLLSRWPSGVQKTRGAPRGGAWRCPCRASSG
jgi:hypothetical protein